MKLAGWAVALTWCLIVWFIVAWVGGLALAALMEWVAS